MDHSQKTCYHCNRKGHIKANCPARKRLDAKPWIKRTKDEKELDQEKEGESSPPIDRALRERNSLEVPNSSNSLRRILGGAGPNRSLTPATLNALEPDPGGNPSKEPSKDPPLQTDSANHHQAICMSVETGIELALTDTVQVTKENQISTGDGLLDHRLDPPGR